MAHSYANLLYDIVLLTSMRQTGWFEDRFAPGGACTRVTSGPRVPLRSTRGYWRCARRAGWELACPRQLYVPSIALRALDNSACPRQLRTGAPSRSFSSGWGTEGCRKTPEIQSRPATVSPPPHASLMEWGTRSRCGTEKHRKTRPPSRAIRRPPGTVQRGHPAEISSPQGGRNVASPGWRRQPEPGDLVLSKDKSQRDETTNLC